MGVSPLRQGEADVDRGHEEEDGAEWDEEDAEAGFVFEMPHTAEEETEREQDDGGTQTEDGRGVETDEIEPGTEGGGEEDEIEQGAVSVGEAEHLPPDMIIEKRGGAEGVEGFEENAEGDPEGE